MFLRKIFLVIIIPGVLFIIGFTSSLLLSSDSFSALTYHNPKLNIAKNPERVLVKGDMIMGSFTSSQDNLGIISLNFKKYEGGSYQGEDRLIFRIKEENSINWYYVNEYGIGTFQKSFTLPFGFPIISDSKDKNYIFEIESMAGNGFNSVILDKRVIFKSIHKFSKAEILSSKRSAIKFMILKTYVGYTNPEFIYHSVIFYMPLFAYLLLILFRRKIRFLKRGLSQIIIVFVVADSLLLQDSNAGVFFIAFGIWVYYVRARRLKSEESFLNALIILTFLLLLTYIGIDRGNDKLSAYSFIFLAIGSIQLSIEIRDKYKRKRGQQSASKTFKYGNLFGNATQLFRQDLYQRIGLRGMFKNKKVLDLGCGYGIESVNFTKFAKSVVGSDIEIHNTWNDYKSKKLIFVKANSQKLPMKSNTFDGVYLKDLLHHVNDPKKTLSEIRRVSKSNSNIVIIEGNRYNPMFFLHATLLNGHNHFAQQDFRKLVLETFPQAEFLALEAYPPYFLNKPLYKIVLYLVKFTQRTKILSRFFSYNVAIIRRK